MRTVHIAVFATAILTASVAPAGFLMSADKAHAQALSDYTAAPPFIENVVNGGAAL